MKSSARWPFRLTALLGLCLGQVFPFGLNQAQEPNPFDLRAELVLLEAEVLNKKTGQAVGELNLADFILYEDGVRQQLTHFSQDQLPLSVLLLFDVSGSVWPRIQQLREGALEALQPLKEADEVAVMLFTGQPKLTLPFTKDKQLAARAIYQASGYGMSDGTDPNEAVRQAAAYLKNATQPYQRRLIIAITDDISTRKVPSKSKTIQELLESGAVVCGLFFDSLYRPKVEPGSDPIANTRSFLITGETDIIKAFVERTGGVALLAEQRNIKESFIQLIERLRTRYSLGYVSSNEQRDGKFRRIKLQVTPEIEKRERGVAIMTRKGYYAAKSEVPARHSK